MDDQAAERAARAFEREVMRGIADQVVELPFGEALLASEFDQVYDLNAVCVDAGARPPAAVAIAAADELLGGAGAAHRTVRYDDGDDMDEVAADFAAAGYSRNSWIVLRWDAPPPAWPPAATELEAEQFDRLNAELMADREWGREQDVVDMFVALAPRTMQVAGGTVVGVLDGGRAVAGARVMGRGAVRQIEEVEVLESHHGRGFGRTLMEAAVNAASKGDPDVVFLVADEFDWPLGWYERFGFRRIGRSGSFQRRPTG